MLASTQQSVAFTSGEHLQLIGTQNTMLTDRRLIDKGAMGNVSVSAEQEDESILTLNKVKTETDAQKQEFWFLPHANGYVQKINKFVGIRPRKARIYHGRGRSAKLLSSGWQNAAEGAILSFAIRNRQNS